MRFGGNSGQTRPIVERFAEIDSWPTCRKTAWLSGAAIFLQCAAAGVVYPFLASRAVSIPTS
ncbi:MAG: hypothetical protein ACR2FE_03590 [Aeromicrobium sp.]